MPQPSLEDILRACQQMHDEGIAPAATVLLTEAPARLVPLYRFCPGEAGFGDRAEVLAARARGEVGVAGERDFLVGIPRLAEGEVVKLDPRPCAELQVVGVNQRRTTFTFAVPVHLQPAGLVALFGDRTNSADRIAPSGD